MATMPIRWKIKDFLRAHSITGYKFMKTSGLPKRTAYRIVNGETRNLNSDTLDATIRALRELTGKPVQPNDIMEWVEA